jgi:hypothetical protein
LTFTNFHLVEPSVQGKPECLKLRTNYLIED